MTSPLTFFHKNPTSTYILYLKSYCKCNSHMNTLVRLFFGRLVALLKWRKVKLSTLLSEHLFTRRHAKGRVTRKRNRLKTNRNPLINSKYTLSSFFAAPNNIGENRSAIRWLRRITPSLLIVWMKLHINNVLCIMPTLKIQKKTLTRITRM